MDGWHAQLQSAVGGRRALTCGRASDSEETGVAEQASVYILSSSSGGTTQPTPPPPIKCCMLFTAEQGTCTAASNTNTNFCLIGDGTPDVASCTSNPATCPTGTTPNPCNPVGAACTNVGGSVDYVNTCDQNPACAGKITTDQAIVIN
jgi:hypothetical protein